MTRWDIAAGSVAPLWMLGYAGAMVWTRSQLARTSFSSELARESQYRRRGKGFARATLVGIALTLVCFGSGYVMRLLHQIAAVSAVIVYLVTAQILTVIRDYLGSRLKSAPSNPWAPGRLPAILWAVARSIGTMVVAALSWSVLWLVTSHAGHPINTVIAARLGVYALIAISALLPLVFLLDYLIPCPELLLPLTQCPSIAVPEVPLPPRIRSLSGTALQRLQEYLQPFGCPPPVVHVNSNETSYLPPAESDPVTRAVTIAEPVLHVLEEDEAATVIAAAVLTQPSEHPQERSPVRVSLKGLLIGIGAAAGLAVVFTAVTYLSLPLPLLLGAVAAAALGIAGWTIYRRKLRLARQTLADAVLARTLPEPDRLLSALRKLEHEERIRIERGRYDSSGGDAAYWREAGGRLSAHRRRADALARYLSEPRAPAPISQEDVSECRS